MQIQNFKSNFLDENRTRYRFLMKLFFLATAILLCGWVDAPAQNNGANKRATKKVVAKNVQLPKAEKNVDGTPTTKTNFPVSVVNTAETDFLSGEASVVVNPKQPTIVRLGLAQNAVSIVEFPASDGVYYIHEGNPKLVSVFQSPTRESDRSITIYPGEGFVIGGQQSAAATITLQMRSGLILILEFVPVGNIRQNAHRCVIGYDRDEIVSARRAAGLAYNLGEEKAATISKNTRANSKLISSVADVLTEETVGKEELIPVKLTQAEVTRGKLSRKENENKQKTPKTGLELSRMVNKKLAECLKNPAKTLGKWSDTNNGLSLAVSSVSEIDSTQRLVIIAVRNNTTGNLRLVPGTPELQILTVDGKSNPLNTERLERTYVETTSFEGLILPGSTVYYAICYNAPVMGANQRLSVLASHREAADSPVKTLLPGVNSAKE